MYITDRSKVVQGSAVAWWLMPRTPDPEVGGSSPTRVKPCCVLGQGTFTPQKVLVIPRKRWLRPNMTENCLPGRLESINQPTNQGGTSDMVLCVACFGVSFCIVFTLYVSRWVFFS